jgi:hypothetical protein
MVSVSISENPIGSDGVVAVALQRQEAALESTSGLRTIQLFAESPVKPPMRLCTHRSLTF